MRGLGSMPTYAMAVLGLGGLVALGVLVGRWLVPPPKRDTSPWRSGGEGEGWCLPRRGMHHSQRYTSCLPLSRSLSSAVLSRASDEHPVVARPWPGGEKRRDERAAHHEAWRAMGSLLLPCTAPGVSLLAGWCLIGATPRGQPWPAHRDTPAGVRRAERTADGGVGDVSRVLAGRHVRRA